MPKEELSLYNELYGDNPKLHTKDNEETEQVEVNKGLEKAVRLFKLGDGGESGYNQLSEEGVEENKEATEDSEATLD